MSWQRAPLYTRVHRLCVWLAARAASGASEPGLVEVRAALRDVLVAIAQALSFPAQRDDLLQEADHALARTRVLLRVACDSGALPKSTARWLFAELEPAGRMIGGWRRSRSTKPAGSPA